MSACFFINMLVWPNFFFKLLDRLARGFLQYYPISLKRCIAPEKRGFI